MQDIKCKINVKVRLSELTSASQFKIIPRGVGDLAIRQLRLIEREGALDLCLFNAGPSSTTLFN